MTERPPTFRAAEDEVEPGIPATSEMPAGVPDGDEDEEEPLLRDYPQGVNQWGTTAHEERIGEPLSERRKREEPDFPRRPARENVRLLDPEDVDNPEDLEADLVADEAEGSDASLSAEEAAMRITDEPPGASYDPDPGYLDDLDAEGR